MFAYAAAQFSDNLWFALISKTIASGSFFYAGLLSIKKIENPSPIFSRFSKTMIWGLLVSVCADILLEIIFEAGFGFFFVAQIIYFFALVRFRKPGKKIWFILFLIDIPLFITEYFNPFLDFGVLFVPLFIYISFVLANTVFSFNLFKSKCKSAKLLPAGLILFFISDYVLQFKLFGSFPEWLNLVIRVVNVFTYFSGQFLIALSLREDFSKE